MRKEACFLIASIFSVSFIAFALPVFAQTPEDIVTLLHHRGNVSFTLADSYSPGQTISTNITVRNDELFPVPDAYLVVELAQGCQTPPVLTQQLNASVDCDAIFYEEKIPVKLAAGQTKSVPFSYALPEDLRAGTSRVDVYLQTPITPAPGMVATFRNAESRAFTVTGDGTFPSVRFVYSKTQVAGSFAQGGAAVSPGSSVDGLVYLKNLASSDFSGNLELKVCSWDDTACPSFDITQSYPVSLTVNEEKFFPISFTAPTAADAYAIRFELNDQTGRLTAIYRARLIVSGDTIQIVKLVNDKPFYDVGTSGNIRTIVTGPYYPAFATTKNAQLTVTLKDLATGAEVVRESRTIAEAGTEDSLLYQFNFTVASRLSKFEVCARTESATGVLFDSYCYNIDSAEFAGAKRVYNLISTYDESAKKLDVRLCATDEIGVPTSGNVNIQFLQPEPFKVVSERSGVAVDRCTDLSFSDVIEGDYKFVVQDIEQKESFEFPVTAAPVAAIPGIPAIPPIYLITIVVVVVIVAVVAVLAKRKKKAPVPTPEPATIKTPEGQ